MPTDLPNPSDHPSRAALSVHHFPLLTAAFTRAVASSGQMTPGQYFRVTLEILRRAPCRLLLFGAGRDTELYVRANADGRTVVLEHHAEWAEAVRHLGCTVVPVAYQTRLDAGLVEPCPLPEGVPNWLLHETWDVILIDAPEGYGSATPGRQQSICLASVLARPGTTVLLHDWHRPHERQCAARYLKQPDELIGERPALAVFHYPPASANSVDEVQPTGVPAPPEEAPQSEAGTVSTSTRPRLLFCSYHGLFDPSSGAAQSARDLLTLLARRGWPCRVLCGPQLDFEGAASPEQLLRDCSVPFETRAWSDGPCPFSVLHFTQAGIPHSAYRPDHTGLPQTPTREEGKPFLALLERTLERFRPELFLTYGGHWLAQETIALAKRHGARVVFWLRNLSYTDADLFRSTDGILVPSRFAQEHYRRTLGLNCTAIASPLDWQWLRCERVEGRYVTFVNPQPAKGVFLFARIAHELWRRRPDIPLLVVEGRGTASRLERTGMDLSELGNLHRMTNTPNPRDFYAVSRLVLMPSLVGETFGRVAAEALLNGIPVLASNRGALPETLSQAGFVFDVPARYTSKSREAPSAAEVASWVETIVRLHDDSTWYEYERQRCLAAAAAWWPERLALEYETFLAHIRDPG